MSQPRRRPAHLTRWMRVAPGTGHPVELAPAARNAVDDACARRPTGPVRSRSTRRSPLVVDWRRRPAHAGAVANVVANARIATRRPAPIARPARSRRPDPWIEVARRRSRPDRGGGGAACSERFYRAEPSRRVPRVASGVGVGHRRRRRADPRRHDDGRRHPRWRRHLPGPAAGDGGWRCRCDRRAPMERREFLIGAALAALLAACDRASDSGGSTVDAGELRSTIARSPGGGSTELAVHAVNDLGATLHRATATALPSTSCWLRPASALRWPSPAPARTA